MACAAAVATIEVIQEEGLLENALQRGRQLEEGAIDGLDHRSLSSRDRVEGREGEVAGGPIVSGVPGSPVG